MTQRLTKIMREAFVRAVLGDVPSVDYQAQADKLARDAVRDAFAKVFPGADYKTASASGWLDKCAVYLPGTLPSVYTFAPDYKMLERDPEVWAKLEELARKHSEQLRQRDNLREKLTGVANTCTTTKQLREALPEFAKYLPEDEPKALRTLPAVQNVVADFVRAGWPKNKAAAA